MWVECLKSEHRDSTLTRFGFFWMRLIPPGIDAKCDMFQGLIRVLYWICELMRIDILTGIAMLSRFLAALRRGHLDRAFHVITDLKRYNRLSVVFDEAEPSLTCFRLCDWNKYHSGGCNAAVSPDAPMLGAIGFDELLCSHKSCGLVCYKVASNWISDL